MTAPGIDNAATEKYKSANPDAAVKWAF